MLKGRLFTFVLCLLLPFMAEAQTHNGKRLVKARGTDSYIIYNIEKEGGAVIVANDDDGTVIGITDNGTFDDAMRNPVFRAMLNNLDNVMAKKNAVKTSRRAEAKGRKSRSVVRGALDDGLKKKVDPLLSDLWHQYYEPYTWSTPVIDSVACVAGCVATAMAQVMNFWKYPEHGYGSHTYEDSLGCGQVLSCDFENHYYDWANMLDNYEGVTYSPAQGYAVANLMSDCGIAVDMKYGTGASGASSIKQPRALYEHFGYDKSAQMHFRDFYTLEEWTRMLKTELSEGRPVLISGHSIHIGHAFVCDGYDERDYFHFSFGNPNGDGNGFFYLPYLTPDFPPSQNINEPENGFNLLQSFVTHLVPATHADATGVENHLFAFSNIEALGADTVVVNRLGNVGWNLHEDSVAIALVKDDEIVELPYVYQHGFLLEELDDTVYTDTTTIKLSNVADGTYKLMVMYCDNGKWTAARTSVGVPNYLIANVKDNAVELVADSANTAYLTLDDYDFPDWLCTSGIPDYSITLKNHGSEFCGRLYILLENVVDSLPIVFLNEQGLTLAADEVSTRHFHLTRTTIPEGEYRLLLVYDNDLFSEDLWVLDDMPMKTVIVSPEVPEAIEDLFVEEKELPSYSLSGVKLGNGKSGSGVVIRGNRKFLQTPF